MPDEDELVPVPAATSTPGPGSRWHQFHPISPDELTSVDDLFSFMNIAERFDDSNGWFESWVEQWQKLDQVPLLAALTSFYRHQLRDSGRLFIFNEGGVDRLDPVSSDELCRLAAGEPDPVAALDTLIGDGVVVIGYEQTPFGKQSNLYTPTLAPRWVVEQEPNIFE